MWIINNRRIFYTLSGILVIASFLSLIVWGLKPGIDFTGGTLIEIQYPQGRPSQSDINSAIAAIDSTASVRPSGTDEFIVRMKPVDQTQKSQVMNALQASPSTASSSSVTRSSVPALVSVSKAPGFASSTVPISATINSSVPGSTTSTGSGQAVSPQAIVKTFDTVGPVLGAEALRKAYVSIALVILGIVLFITFAFRKVSEPVSSWKYGLTAIVALVHNVIIPVGVFSILGHFSGYEVDTLFVTALLVILGFSIHDTIVVFDRVRENLRLNIAKKPFDQVVGQSVSQTFTRSVNTSLTTLIALVVLYIFGGSSTEHFSLALIIGIAAGTYSSIFIGSPLLVTIERWGRKAAQK